jgi:serine/threonine protein kinase
MDEQSVDGGTDPVPADLTGTLLAEKYRVVRPLGRGSTGTVYLCWHAALEKHVAVKVLHPELSGNPGIVTRFQREAQATARLDHAHSVRVSDFGHDDAGDFLYLVMEYVEGRDLGQVLEEDWPLSDERIVSIMSQVLSALAAAHALGIVHRDLKPENILVRAASDASGATDGKPVDDVKVCDFGIAQLSPIRLTGPASGQAPRMHAVTAQGRVVGTPAYMSPEQARAEAQDARSDIYAAGVVLFQLLTRTTPFVAETPLSVAVMHCVTPPPPPSGFRPVNPALEAACLKALSKTREARFQSAREMQLALEAAVGKRAPQAATRRSAPPAARGRASSIALSATASQSLTPAEVVVADSTPKRQFTKLKGAAVAAVILALLGLPGILHRKPSTNSGRASAPLATGVEATLLPASAPPATPALSVRPYAVVASTTQPPTAAHVVAQPNAAHVATTATKHESSALARATPIRRAARRGPAEHARLQETESSTASLELAAANETPATLLAAATLLDVPEPEPTVEAPTNEPETAATLPASVTLSSSQPTAAEPPPALVVPAVALRLAPPPPAAAGQAPHIDPAHASVSIGTPVSHHAAVSKASLRSAINQSALTRCYQDALRSGAAPAQTVDARLDISTGTGGRVVSASLDSSLLSRPLRQCIEQVARAGRVREADTGEAQASVTLTFQPR